MQYLSNVDVEQLVSLVASAADPTARMPLPDRKRQLLSGVAELVDADIWYWVTVVLNPEVVGDVMATSMIDGGWQSDEERLRFLQIISAPKVRPLAESVFGKNRQRHVTHSRELLPSHEARVAIDEVFNAVGIGHFLISQYPLDASLDSAIGLYRRLSRPAFTERDRVVAHVVFSQVDWLHRHGSDVTAKDAVLHLSRREREVVVYLLGGDSQNDVVRKLGLSRHTVGDYVKRIYKRFSVSSRSELLAHFIAGGTR